jgi:hypothetical protein
MAGKASAGKLGAKKKSAKKPIKVAAKKAPAKKKPHLKLVPKTENKAKPKNKKESVGDVFKRLLEMKEQRRKQNTNWFSQGSNSYQTKIDEKHQLRFSRFNGPRRKAA